MHGDGLENLEKITSEILDDFFDYLDVKQNSLWAVNDDLVYCFVNIIFGLVRNFYLSLRVNHLI